MFFDQREYQVRCEWGESGVETLGPISDVVIIVDVLSFSTCVEIAVDRGASVWPCRWKDETASVLADERGALLAGPRGSAGYSLSPASLLDIPSGTGLVLPSPNGSALTLAAAMRGTVVLAGCLRNATAVARAARSLGRTIAVIPAGERWPDGSLRPALEDWLGAGAIISELGEGLSAEAIGAASTFHGLHENLRDHILSCGSGRELRERGYEEDVFLAAEHGVSPCVPIVQSDGPNSQGTGGEVGYCYRRWTSGQN